MTRSPGSVRQFPARRPLPVQIPSRGPRLDRRRRLRLGGWLALLIGIVGSGLIFWQRVQHATPTIAELLPASAREHRRQMRILYGTVGALAIDLEEAIARPGTQVAFVLVACSAIAAACFQAARSSEGHEED